MVTEVTEKRVLSLRQVDTEFDGQWVLLNKRAFPTSECRGVFGGVWRWHSAGSRCIGTA
jgi:hypothetical protein